MFSQDEKDLLERIARALELLALETPIALIDAARCLSPSNLCREDFVDDDNEAWDRICERRKAILLTLDDKKEGGRNSGRGGK